MMKAADGWSPAWKSGTSVAETTMKPGTTVGMVVSGAVGAQGSAAGGGNQLHFFLPPADRSSVFKVVGGRAL